MLVASAHVEGIIDTKEEIQEEIVRVFGESAENALCIARMESGYRADATNQNTNGTWDLGSFQINDVHGMSWDDRMDARTNIAKAKEIRDAWGSWRAWMAAQKCGL